MTYRFLVLVSLLFLAACAPSEHSPAALTGTARAVSTAPIVHASASPDPDPTSGDFPLTKGTTWVYSYEEYEPDPNTPTHTTTATFLITNTVTATQWVRSYFIAHVQHQENLIKADPGWGETGPRRAGEFWYVVDGQRVYESLQALDLAKFQPDYLPLVFDFPLTPGKRWCPQTILMGQKVLDCAYSGEISVGSPTSYNSEAGTFAQCYQLTQNFTSGPIIQWFCSGIGIVAEKYDHAGTRFGFRNNLLRYSRGSS